MSRRRIAAVRQAVALAMKERSATNAYFHVSRNAFWDDPPDTYRVLRRQHNGWVRLLKANPVTGEVYEVKAQDPADVEYIRAALAVLRIPGTVEWQNGEAVYRRAAS